MNMKRSDDGARGHGARGLGHPWAERIRRTATVWIALLAIAVPALLATSANGAGADGMWSDTNGSWGTKGNWSGDKIADGADKTATFNLNMGADLTVTLDSNRTIGNLTFGDTASPYYGWYLANPSGHTYTLTLKSNATPTITVNPYSRATISLVLADDSNDGLTKAGTGTLILSGANTLSGPTNVSAGTLLLKNTSGSGTGTGAVTVASGATVGGSGSVTGSVNIQVGGHLAPGNNSIGTLSTGALSLSGLSDLELGTPGTSHASPGTSDRTLVSGALTLGGTLNLIDNAGANGQGSAGAGSYKIFNCSVSGSFATINSLTGLHAKVDTGTSGSVFLDLYRLAAASAHTPEPISLGNIHVGETFGTQALTLTNTAANDGYSEKLNASFSGTTGGATASGSFNLLAPGATSTNLLVGLNTGTAGAKSGTATIALVSDGAGTSGLGTTALASQTVNISGNVYRLASANSIATPVNLDSIRVGGTFGTQALSIQNTAAADLYSEKLDASFGALTGSASTNGGTIDLLGAGLTDNTSMSVGLGTAVQNTRGTFSGTALVNLVSDGSGTSGLGTTNLTGQEIEVTGDVVGPVFGSSVSVGSLIDFGEVSHGSSLDIALTLWNSTLDPALGNLTDLSLLSYTLTSLEGPLDFSVVSFSPTVLNKGGSTDYLLRFSPIDGPVSARLTFLTDVGAPFGGLGASYYFDLLGKGIPLPAGGDPNAAPEPVTLAGLGLGILGLVRYVRRRR